MKMKKVAVLVGVTLAVLFTGCGNNQLKMDALGKDRVKMLEGERSYQSSIAPQQNPKLYKKVTGSFFKTPVYVAMKKIAKKAGLHFDKTFAPSNKYRITTIFNGTVEDFLHVIKKQSGVDYRFSNGMIEVFNKNYIEKQYRSKRCGGKGQGAIKIDLKSVPPRKVFEHFSKRFKIDISYDEKFFNVSGNKTSLKALPSVSFKYRGCDPREAIVKFAKANDLDIAFSGKNEVVVRDYKTAQLDIPTYYKSKFQSTGGSIGNGNDQAGNTLSENLDYQKEIESLISTYLSPEGKAFFSNRGFVTITDVPSAVNSLRNILRKEVNSQEPIHLSISIIRLDLNDNYEQGVDWNIALRGLGKGLNIRDLSIGTSYAGGITGGLEVGGISNNKDQVLKMLSKYGKTKIVRDYSGRTRSGILSTFKSVRKIPYVTTSVINNGTTTERVAEAKEVEAGIIINVKPTLAQSNELVHLAMDAVISEYLGDKKFNVGGDEFLLPEISSNHIQMPVTVRMNHTVILTGLRLRTTKGSNEGIPELSRQPIVGGLFGKNSQEASISEFLILVTPTIVN